MIEAQPRTVAAAMQKCIRVSSFLTKGLLLCLALTLFILTHATPLRGADDVSGFKMNPYEVFSPEANKLKFSPSAGVGAYWGDGRFNVSLNNFYDEQASKCFFQRTTCFRQDGEFVCASGKDGWLVLNLAAGTYQVKSHIEEFDTKNQEFLKKLKSKSPGNIYFNQSTLMPKL